MGRGLDSGVGSGSGLNHVMFMSSSVTTMSKFVVSLSVYVLKTLYAVMCHLVTSHSAIFLRRAMVDPTGP